MSSSDSKRSKRRRNKRGGGKSSSNRPASAIVSNGNTLAAKDGQVMATIPVPSALSELDLDNHPQPLSQMPRSHNPYLDREHCLLCRRERPDPPENRIPREVGDEKENNRQLPITQMPLWLCPDCRRTVEEEEANPPKGFDPSAIGELLLPPTLPLITGLQNLDAAFSTTAMADSVPAVVTSISGGKAMGGGGGDGPCQCEPCRERREIAAEQEHSRQHLGECWTELSHLVRCVYWEAGTSLTGEESTTKLSLPRMKELVHQLVAHDPHPLYLRLEAEVEDFIKEMLERLLKQLGAGFKTPPLAKQFITMLLEEYAALCSAAQTLGPILEELEKEHLQKFKLTWTLHNKHLFHFLIYMEQGLHDNLGTLINQLRQGAGQKEPYREESYANLLKRYHQFDNDMSIVAVVWRDCQQLIEDYIDEQELYKGKDTISRSWDVGVPIKQRPRICEASRGVSHSNKRNLFQSQSTALIGHKANGGTSVLESGSRKGSSCKKKCMCDDCSLNRITSSLFTPDLYEEIGLRQLTEAPGGQLSALDNYLQSINPPDLSSTSSSSECSSQEDSEEVIPIFSRSDLIPSGFCSPRSEDSDDSDDLDSESSPSPSHENAFEEDDDEEGEKRLNGITSSSRGRVKSSHSRRSSSPGQVGSGQGERQSGVGETKKDSSVPSSRPCECPACTINHSAHLPATTTMTASIGEKIDLTSKPSYLFYPNLTNHQPLDLSHHGITAKHPLIHPHLYNLTSQKLTKVPNHTQQPFQLNMDASDGLHAYGDWNSAYESAKMVLTTHAHYGQDDQPDLVQSAEAALQSNCRAEKLESGKRRSSMHQHGGSGEQLEPSCKVSRDEKAKKHSHNGSEAANTMMSIGEWAKQQRLTHAQQQQQQLHQGELSGKKSGAASTPDMCSKHNLPTVPKIPAPTVHNRLFFPPILQADAAAGTLSQEALAQKAFTQGVLTQKALMTQGMLPPGPGLQLQDAGLHMADVQHHQNQSQHQQGSSGKKKRGLTSEPSSSLDDPAVVRVPDYLTDQQLQPCSHHNNQASLPTSVLDTNSGLCNNTMQTTASTPTSASVCSSDPDYETPSYMNDDDILSSYDDKNMSATGSNRERESKHCECCYCEFFGHGPQPAPTSRNYTEIRDRLRLRLRERKQPKEQSPSHEESTRPASDALPHDERPVEDLLTYIEGDKKEKSSSKAAKRQRQRQRRAEERAKQGNVEDHKGNPVHIRIPVTTSLHHHHHHHHHHHMEDVRKQHDLYYKLQQQQQQQQQQTTKHTTPPTSMEQPRPHDQTTCSATTPSLSLTSSSSAASSVSSTTSSFISSSTSSGTLQECQGKPRVEANKKKQKAPNPTKPQPQATAPSSPARVKGQEKNEDNAAKGKRDGGLKQTTSSTPEVNRNSKAKPESERVQQPHASTKVTNKRDHSNRQGPQQQPREKGEKVSGNKHESDPLEKANVIQDRRQNGHSSDGNSSTSSSRSNSVGSKAHATNNNRQSGSNNANNDDKHSKKQANKVQASQTTHNGTTHQKGSTTTTSSKKSDTSNSNKGGSKEQTPHEKSQQQQPATKPAGKKMENNHHIKSEPHPPNRSATEPLTNGTMLPNGNANNGNSTSNNKRKKKKRNSSDNPNASIDEIFLPKENVDMNEMDETERELEAFKRFCLASTPQQHKEKVVFNIKDMALKFGSLKV